MAHYSFETVELLREEMQSRDKEARSPEQCASLARAKCPECELPVDTFAHVDYYRSEIAFDLIREEGRRPYFRNLPTTFSLPAATVECLVGLGGTLLVESPGFTKLLDDLDQDARAAGAVPPERAAPPGYVWPCR